MKNIVKIKDNKLDIKDIPYKKICTNYLKDNYLRPLLDPYDLKEYFLSKLKDINITIDDYDTFFEHVNSYIQYKRCIKVPLDKGRYGYVSEKYWNEHNEASRHTIYITAGLLELLLNHSNKNFLNNINIDNIIFYPIPIPQIKFGSTIISQGYIIPLSSNNKLIEVVLEHINNVVTKYLNISDKRLHEYIQNTIYK